MTYLEPYVTLAYSEPCNIPNPGIFITQSIFRTLWKHILSYSERCVLLAYWELYHLQNFAIFKTRGPQGSILGPLLFNLFINDLFLFLERTNTCSFADGNKIYRCDSDLEIILEDLQHDMKILLNWFKIKLMKPNPKKFQFMILGKGWRLPVILNINNIKTRESQKVMLLRLTIDNCLIFKDHIDTLGCNGSYKLHALRSIRKYRRNSW